VDCGVAMDVNHGPHVARLQPFVRDVLGQDDEVMFLDLGSFVSLQRVGGNQGWRVFAFVDLPDRADARRGPVRGSGAGPSSRPPLRSA
jgi:hypothetical protein